MVIKHPQVKENVRKRTMDGGPLGGLGRQGAVRKRKGEVHEMNGHKFVQQQFYQLMLCAFCGDFLLNALGYQCEDCRYTCHKKCYEKVVTKCISKSTMGVCDHPLSALRVLLTYSGVAGRRRGEDQPSHPASLRTSHKYWCKLVLSLWIYAPPRSQKRSKMFRVRYHLPCKLRPFSPRFLRYVNGNRQRAPSKLARYQQTAWGQGS